MWAQVPLDVPTVNVNAACNGLGKDCMGPVGKTIRGLLGLYNFLPIQRIILFITTYFADYNVGRFVIVKDSVTIFSTLGLFLIKQCPQCTLY
jgi:hypothetical protein